jgi:hypothetical protein
MIGNDPERGGILAVGSMAEGRSRRIYQMAEKIRLKDAFHTLQDRRHALKTHAGVDGGARQVDAFPASSPAHTA